MADDDGVRAEIYNDGYTDDFAAYDAKLCATLHNNDEGHQKCGWGCKRSIKKAREHRFNHEEGLANEKLATYLLHKSKHAEALQYFKDAKKCYSTWGATVLEQRIEKAITVLSPLCIGDLV